ncbi:MAG: thiamine-phosphate kinase, partial [Chloroflexi bacterium]|nr:thiamine-phosphate kinase [Chloroflexota bacterium]
LVVDLGDDAAVWQSQNGYALATTDTMVEGVHFRPEWTTWRELGWKALATNVSDVAAMGGHAEHALVTLGVSREAEVESLQELYHGLSDCARAFEVAVVGGDVVASEQTFVTIALYGSVPTDATGVPGVLRRSGAKPGELIAVTGHLGDSAGGLRSFQMGYALTPAVADLRLAHNRPQPRAAIGARLFAAGVRCALDVSDGLAGDLRHVTRQGRVGARIWAERLPASEALHHTFPSEWSYLALHGGEDYELLFTAAPEVVECVTDVAAQLGGVPVTTIGEILPGPCGEVLLVDLNGTERPLNRGGYDHLA